MKHLLNFKEDFTSKHDNTTIIPPSLQANLLQPGIGPLQSCQPAQPCLNTTALGLIRQAVTVQVNKNEILGVKISPKITKRRFSF